ncbi:MULTISPECIES: hypothetical protein [Sphingomonas]|jgi:hypothetical protein|uniref:Uncharacterized protein n=1 Tax=Sphingomonas zeae TaxID=1646122 RepID=A0A7Y6B7L5_9SPHN|nr:MULTISPECIES: hypothetical protein [Sphingomonas]MBB4046789.1 hypothetical protein [Sphingomonas zeae]MDK8184563.1 hypothetical protein [Sphingomonas zeae]MDK8214348.1 hypothetical protein [Sphingomonas sp. UMB7805-LC452B]NUU48895.1 hypothetical protein [Sphingomonas zeae]
MAIVTGIPTKVAVSTVLVLIAIGIAAGVTHVHGVKRGKTYAMDQPVQAAAYEWPPNCPRLNYRKQDRLSKNCTYRRRYRLINHSALGLSIGKGEVWYRVANDALLLNCQTWGRTCVIKARVYDKFRP